MTDSDRLRTLTGMLMIERSGFDSSVPLRSVRPLSFRRRP